MLKDFEGFEPKPYLDSAGFATIGYGFTYYPNGTRVGMQDKKISQKHATEILGYILKNYEAAVLRNISVSLTDNQFSALVSFTYNLGPAALQRSTLRRVINRGEYEAAPEQFMRWVYAGGRKLRGLIRRRRAEANLFLT